MKNQELTFYRSNTWTRKVEILPKKATLLPQVILSNIDVVAARNFSDEITDVKFLRHTKKLSDHVPI